MTDAEIRAIRERARLFLHRPFMRDDKAMTNHLRTDVPALCDAVEEARKVLRESLSIADEAGLIGPAIEVGTVDSDTQAWIDRLRAWENNLRRALGEEK
jgi:hypothetical protein